MALKDGDVVRLDYTLWVAGEKKPIETSREDVAQQHGILRESKAYRPLAVTLGRRQVLPALEAHIQEHGVAGKTVVAELAAKDAYGVRDPGLLKDVPMARFRKQKIEPRVGMELTVEGRRAVVARVAGGRVRLDLNHELAGKDLRYEYTVHEVVTDDAGKVDAVLKAFFPEGVEVELAEDAVTVDLPDQAKFSREWPMHKFRLLTELRAAAGDGRAIRLVETYPVPQHAHGEEE